ncbi:hypothetical protein ACFLZX_03470 [Nanoarchaeota archaeon]
MKNKKNVLKPIILSSKAIEVSYSDEKKKIDRDLEYMERDRLKGYLELMNKRGNMVKLKLSRLIELENHLNKHASQLRNNIENLKKKKVKEKMHFDQEYQLNEHLKRIETQIQDITGSRKTLLQKEARLLKEVKEFFKANKKDIEKKGLKKINTVLEKKTKILEESYHLINQDINTILKDKKELEKITDKQLDKIYKINKQIINLKEVYRTLLKKRQQLKLEDFEFKQMLADIKIKKKNLEDELKKFKI